MNDTKTFWLGMISRLKYIINHAPNGYFIDCIKFRGDILLDEEFHAFIWDENSDLLLECDNSKTTVVKKTKNCTLFIDLPTKHIKLCRKSLTKVCWYIFESSCYYIGDVREDMLTVGVSKDAFAKLYPYHVNIDPNWISPISSEKK